MGYTAVVADAPEPALALAARGGLRSIIVDGRTGGLDAAFWARLERTLVRLPGADRPFVYVASAAAAAALPTDSQVARGRCAPQAPRVIDLVRAVDGLAWGA
jgi:hypothetical protein